MDSTKTRLLRDVDVHELYDIPVSTLMTARSRGYGPAYIKLGAAVRYRIPDIEGWIRASTVSPEQLA